MDETFNTKAFHWPLNNVNVRIILQNKNGPCPLIALFNGLVLNNHAQALSFIKNKNTVKLHSLLEFLGDLLLNFDSEQQQASASHPEGEGSVYDDINQVLNVLPQLNTGLNVDPLFLHDDDANDEWFENEQHDLAIFKIFGIKLVHGWLMDPAALSDYKTVKNRIRSFDNYQLISLQDSPSLDTPGGDANDDGDFQKGLQDVSQFLQRYPSQLSDYGLEYLLDYFARASSAGPGNTSVKILFRNNHFSTIFYNPLTNQLFTLVTDSSLIDGNLVWQSLSSVTGDLDMFYDENFQLSTSDGTHVNNNSASTGEATGTGGSGDVDSADLKLAQSLQLQEDEILAREFEQKQQEQQQQRQQQRRTQQRQGQTIGQATGGTGNLNGKRNNTNGDSRQEKDKKCIIC